MIPLIVVSSLAGLGILFSLSLIYLLGKFIYPWMATPIIVILLFLLLSPYLIAFSPFLFFFLIGIFIFIIIFFFLITIFGVQISFNDLN